MNEDTEGNESWPIAHVEFASQSLDRASRWVQFADAKVGAMLVILGIAFGDLASHARLLYKAPDSVAAPWGEFAAASLFVALATAALTVWFCARALTPKLIPGEESIAYFGDVAQAKSAEEFRTQLRGLSDQQLTDHLAAQVWDVSRIAKWKFARVRLAFFFVLLFLAAWALGRVILALAS